MKYHNYHKHTMYSNLRTLDCVTKPIDYINRAKELGHDTYFTTEHGWQGNLFEAQTLCEANDIRCIYGTEAYYVDDITTETGRRAYHLILIAMNYAGRREINSLLSKANTDGFYYKPRMDREMVLSLTPENVVVTTACLAGRLSGEDAEKEFLIPFKEHFKDHFFLEVQCHVNDDQKEYNKMIMEYHKKYNIPIIHANDSHYITAADSQYRDLFLKAKGIVYEEETGMLLDYPDSDEIIRRYLDQGVLSLQEAETAIENTLIFDHAESVFTDKEFKIPKIINGDSNKHLRTLLNKAWNIEKKNIPADLHKKYEQEIQYEYKIVEDCGMADYFILDHYAVKRAVEKYNAVLTRSGRGSAVSFYINKLLGLTEVDRISAPITLYPTRFMSAERILSSRSLPDIDLNFASVEPVIKATKDILGEDGVYYMVAYKPLQESSGFRLWCKAHDLHISEYDEVAKNLEQHADDPKWKSLIEGSKHFVGVVESVAPSPCSFLLSNDKISEMVGLIKVGDVMCCCLDGYNCDVYKFLKNDYLTVSVYSIIDGVYKLLGQPIDKIDDLLAKCDDRVWDLYADGITSTINQADSDYDKSILKRYKPKNLSELAAYVAAIRPGFASLLENFIERRPYTTGVKELDDILEDSFHYLMYQESIMKYLVWLGIEEKTTYDIIKKIAKKKFKEHELNELKQTLLGGWIRNVGTEDGFADTWKVVEDAASYSFNSAHALSVAIDSLYGAYLKANYPLEYFTVTMSLYSGDIPRTICLTKELEYFGIELKGIKFRYSKADYNMDRETNSIFKGLSSVKYISAGLAEQLYAMKDDRFDSFIDFLDVNPCDSKQTSILICLGYFDEFGDGSVLQQIQSLYLAWRHRKQISIESCPLPEDSMLKYAVKTDKTYKIFDPVGMTKELCGREDIKPMSLQEIVRAEIEYLGYINYVNKDLADDYYVIDINAKFSPVVKAYSFGTGETITMKINKQIYANAPLSKNDIIRVYFTELRPKARKLPDGTWERSKGEFDKWITSYSIVK